MATDLNIESIISAGDTLCAPPTISYSAPVEEISTFVTRHIDSGVPCVITGFPHDEGDTQSPFTHSARWLESFYRPEGEQCGFMHNFFEIYARRTETILPCPSEWVSWLQESLVVPRCLVPCGNNDLFSDGENISMKVFGPETSASDVSLFVCCLSYD